MKTIKIFTYSLLYTIALCSCNDEPFGSEYTLTENEDVMFYSENLYDYLNDDFDCERTYYNIYSINARNVDWQFNDVPDWITIYPENSNQDNGHDHYVIIEENLSIEPREATYTLSHNAAGITETIEITTSQQGASPVLKWANGYTSITNTIACDEQIVVDSVVTNLSDITCTCNNPIFSASYDNATKKLSISAPKNNDTSSRNCVVTLYSARGDLMAKYTLIQQRSHFLSWINNQTEGKIYLSYPSQAWDVEVLTNVTDITCSVTDNSLVGSHFTASYNNNTRKLTISALENSDTYLYLKEGTVTLTSEKAGGSITLAISQSYDAKTSNLYINGHEYIDLGLSVKWAAYNIGASDPIEPGYYYMWGYCGYSEYYHQTFCDTYDVTMSDISGSSTYDAAGWLWGGTWRIPTQKEMQELIDNSLCLQINTGSTYGYIITSQINGNSIFLPAVGYYDFMTLKRGEGHYWTSSPYTGKYSSYALNFTTNSISIASASRYYGYSIRAVSN